MVCNTEVGSKAHNGEVSWICYCSPYMTVISASWDYTTHVYHKSDLEHGYLLVHTSDITI